MTFVSYRRAFGENYLNFCSEVFLDEVILNQLVLKILLATLSTFIKLFKRIQKQVLGLIKLFFIF